MVFKDQLATQVLREALVLPDQRDQSDRLELKVQWDQQVQLEIKARPVTLVPRVRPVLKV